MLLNPLVGLIVAAAFQAPGEAPDYARIVALEIVQAVQEADFAPVAAAAAEPCVRDTAFYFDVFRPLPAPPAPLIVTYDWRSPVFFDLP